ncbi:hypothetical protein PHMEG_00012510 [Phytophthora megakarya]|uniref:ZSWIM1/3 RNaseH-like domain-containing protein n=1 Tax=Phytophthora megakarya TaxID=4795 RepID=A0A225W904_9STRA|nr:hypothetical protein PHMEG_00012510 [Phytophthora megakarya]
MQTLHMREAFSWFSEVLLIDATHCTNKIKYITLLTAIEEFKLNNPKWREIQCFIVNNDFTEIAVLKAALPGVRVLLCQFHVIKYLSEKECKWLSVNAISEVNNANRDLRRNENSVQEWMHRFKDYFVRYRDNWRAREDEVPSSSLAYDSKPAAGTRRPGEADSDASSSKRPRSVSDAVPSRLEALVISLKQRDATRTDDSVRYPWIASERVITARYGYTVPPNEIPLYVDNRIVDDADAA